MKTIIITGINGFVGRHLTRELINNGYAVIGIGREEIVDPEIGNLLKNYIVQDIAVAWPKIDTPIEAIINLAGLAAIGPSFDNPQKYIHINSSIVTNMCEFYMNKDKKPRIIVVSSGAVYDAHQDMPLKETSIPGFDSPYVVSKLLNESQSEYYYRRGLEVIVVRPFNHIGSGQGPGFLIPDLLRQIKISKENNSSIKVGNLKTKRDYTDVRDVAKAYRLLSTTKELHNHIYNVCSGESRSGEEILSLLQKFTEAENTVIEVDRSKIRPNDPLDHYGSAQKLREDTGWQPTFSLEQTLKDSLYG